MSDSLYAKSKPFPLLSYFLVDPNMLRVDIIAVEETPSAIPHYDSDSLVFSIMINESKPLVRCTLQTLQPAFIPLETLHLDNCVRVMIHRNDELYGTISFDKETEFGHLGVSLTQWITLFEDTEDDIYDGSLGEDDEESPRVQLCFTTVTPE